jgi:acyl-CoA thioesterase FadM
VRIDAMSARTIRYAHTLTRGSTVIATGTMTAACVENTPPPLRATDIPEDVKKRLETV